jgi:hypothetical protein
MNTPAKPKKTPRNKPLKFDETLSVSMPVPATSPVTARLTFRQIRLILGLIWVLAAVMAGIGIGRLIHNASTPLAKAEAPVPVASAQIQVLAASAFLTPAIIAENIYVQPTLRVESSTAVNQAQVGTVITTLNSSMYQPATEPDSLQPGFNHFGRPQGTIGTALVE